MADLSQLNRIIIPLELEAEMSPAVTAFVLTLIARMEVMVSEDEEIRMPHDLPALSPSEIDRIRLWIAEGEAIVRNNLLIAGKNASFANTDHQEKTVNDMIICNSLIAAWLLLLSLTGCLERIHLHHLVDASSQIEIGATEFDVVAILGAPTEQYEQRGGWAQLLMGARPRQWMYGTTINLRHCIVPHLPFPNPLPINVRIFEYDKNDLIIDWSAAGTVTRLERPTIAIPKGSEKWLEPVYFFAKNLKFLSRKHHELNR